MDCLGMTAENNTESGHYKGKERQKRAKAGHVALGTAFAHHV